MQIAHKIISRRSEPFVIAEMSGNHNQSLSRALKIVEAAAKSGVHGLKLQTYTPDTMTLNLESDDFEISDPDSPWHGRKLYDLYREAYTPWEWHKPIFLRAKELGLVAFSTPFDETAVDFLEDLDVPCYKIASFENADIPLIKRVARTKKPIIISTGMASLAELDETMRIARANGCPDIILLKCTSTYPASPENSNLLTLPHMRELFDCEVGLSDHSLGVGVATASIALGATVIEKHFTLNRSDGGVDSSFSMEPEEMKLLVNETRKAWQALGKVCYGTAEAEKNSLKFKRSLYIFRDIKEGDTLSPENVRVIRPGFGLHPRYHSIIMGKKVNKNLSPGTPLKWDHIG